MNHKKRWLVIGIISLAIVVAGSIGGAVLAADDATPAATATTTPQVTASSSDTLLDKIIAIYKDKTGTSIDKSTLQASIQEAQKEMRMEELQTRLQNMVTNGRITQEEADQILAWYQSMPDVLSNYGLGLGGHGRMMGGPGCFMR